MFAKRAWFLDEPYYFNRRDNESSSVYDPGKVFCICDEYKFILDIIAGNPFLISTFRTTYGYICYRSYHWNLLRIDGNDQLTFLQRFYSDFSWLNEHGYLSGESFPEDEWEDVTCLLKGVDRYYLEKVKPVEDFFSSLETMKNIIIYGAGFVGRYVFRRLAVRCNPNQMIAFAVSSSENNPKKVYSLDVKPIGSLKEYCETGNVIIAVSGDLKYELYEYVKQLGFTNVSVVPDCV